MCETECVMNGYKTNSFSQ